MYATCMLAMPMPVSPRDNTATDLEFSRLRLRWAVNIRTWSPTELDLAHLADAFPPEDRAQCNQFVHLADRKRAVASRVLQRSFGSRAFQQRPEDVELARTCRGKPFFVHAHPVARHLNFNVSHEV